MESCDTLIIGAGPIGLELAVSLKQAGVHYIQLDAGSLAQTVVDYPPQTSYFSSPERIAIAGVALQTPDQTKATREQYLAYLRGVAQQFALAIRTHQPITALKQNEDGTFTATTPTQTYHATRVVLAIGDMHHPRLLNIPGEDLPHVSHYLREPHQYFGQRLLIVGGRNSAVEAALRCNRAGAKVTLSYRRDAFDSSSIKYWLLPEIEALIKHRDIAFHPQTIPTQITDTDVELTSVSPTKNSQSKIKKVPADAVLLLTGYTQDKTLFEQLGITRSGENNAPHFDADTMMSNIKNVYIAGTAAAGTQNHFKLFIENCHPHVTKITRSITGSPPPDSLVNQAAQTYGLPES